eukprot:gene8327-151_t
MVICEECEKKEATCYCPDCYIILCPDCVQDIHSFNKRKQQHLKNLVAMEKYLEKKKKDAKRRHSYFHLEKCPDHLLPLILFCRTCDELICDSCPKTKQHQNHLVVTQDKINREIEEDYKVLIEKYSTFKSTLSRVNSSLENVQTERIQMKDHIIKKKNVLLNLIEQMTNEMLNEVETVQKEKIQQLENQQKYLVSITGRTLEAIKSVEETDKIGNIVESVNIKENIEKIKFKTISKEPAADIGFNKFLDTNEQIMSIQNMKLKPILDVKNCYLEGDAKTAKVNQSLTFIIKAVSKLGNIINLDVNPFSVSLISGVENAKFEIENLKFDTSIGIYFKVKSDYPGKYKIRIQSNKIDIQDSPLTITFNEDNSNTFDLTIACWYGATYNPYKQEFWIKSSYASRIIHRFDKSGVNLGDIQLPYECMYLSADQEGNLFIANGLNQFLMLDSKLNPVWIIEHEDTKQAFPICCSNDVEDENFCYAIFKQKILVLDKEDGAIRKMINPNQYIEDPSSIINLNEEIWISDLFDIKVFDKSGNFKRKVDIESCALTIYQNQVFYCYFNSTNWRKVTFD